MKKITFCLFFIVFSTISVFSQEGMSVSSKIIWQEIVTEDLPGLGKHSMLTFQNSQYNFKNHFFPIYSKQIALPYGASSIETKIIDAQYIPLNENEKSVITSYDSQAKRFMGDDVRPEITISVHKKRPYAYIHFIPIRMNKSTGDYEKLVSFSLTVLPIYNQGETRNTGKSYASNSVLSSGMWYKVAV